MAVHLAEWCIAMFCNMHGCHVRVLMYCVYWAAALQGRRRQLQRSGQAHGASRSLAPPVSAAPVPVKAPVAGRLRSFVAVVGTVAH